MQVDNWIAIICDESLNDRDDKKRANFNCISCDSQHYLIIKTKMGRKEHKTVLCLLNLIKSRHNAVLLASECHMIL